MKDLTYNKIFEKWLHEVSNPYAVSLPALCLARNRAQSYNEYAEVIHEIGQRLFSRLDYLQLAPSVILELGCATGHFSQLIAERYAQGQIIALDPGWNMCKQAECSNQSQLWPVVSGYHQLPFAGNSIDFIFTNMSLSGSDDWPGLSAELYRVLKPEGLLMFAIPGPETLSQLRHAWQQIDDHLHVAEFNDMHDIGDALLHQGFADPVVDMELLSLCYPSLNDLLNELRQLAYQNTLTHRNQYFTSKFKWQKLHQLLPGKIEECLEVIYGHARKPETTKHVSMSDIGEAAISPKQIQRLVKP